MAVWEFNRGEWTEAYVFLRLLGDGRIYGASANLVKDELTYIDIINSAVCKTGKLSAVSGDSHLSSCAMGEACRTVLDNEVGCCGISPAEICSGLSNTCSVQVGRTDTGVEVIHLNVVNIEINVRAAFTYAQSDISFGLANEGDLERHPLVSHRRDAANSMECGVVGDIGYHTEIQIIAIAAISYKSTEKKGVDRSIHLGQNQSTMSSTAGIEVH